MKKPVSSESVSKRWVVRPIVFAVSWCVISAPLNAIAGDLNSEVNAMFNNLGAVGNYTAPGAMKSQVYNTYTGGSFYMRSPQKSYNLATLQFPNAKGGCGGIDLFAGSFSHISGQELKDMLKNITAALPGVAFQVALDVLSPLLGGVTKWLQPLQDAINNKRIGSCETAISLVSSAAEAVGFDEDQACAKVYTMVNGGDQDKGVAECQKDRKGILNKARTSTDPQLKSLPPLVGNLVWQALKRVDTLDDAEREFIMSMSGTVIYPDSDENGIATTYVPTLTNVKQLLYGEQGTGTGEVLLTVLRCDDYTDCKRPYMDATYKHVSFLKKVSDLMHSISDKIRFRQELPNNSPEVGFINQTSEPVYRMLSIGNTNLNMGMADGLIDQYSGVIAADYAHTFLERNFRMGLMATMQTYKLNRDQKDDMERLAANTRALLTALGQEKIGQYAKVQSFAAISDQLERLERQLRAGMPQNVVDMLGYQASLNTK